MSRRFFWAVLVVLSCIYAVPVQAERLQQRVENFLDNHHVPYPPTEVPLEKLFIQLEGNTVPVAVSSVLLPPPRRAGDSGAKLQLPYQIATTKLIRNAKALAIFDWNNDGVMMQTELVAGLITWAYTSKLDRPFSNARFFYGRENAMMPIDYFTLSYQDAAYLRRTIALYGRAGSADLLSAIDNK